MKLEYPKAESVTRRPKILMFGPEGSGKTLLALQFPNPIVIDMERGTDLYGSQFDFAVQHVVHPDDVMEIVTDLLTKKHDYRTLVIDPMTIYWQSLQDKWKQILYGKKQTDDTAGQTKTADDTKSGKFQSEPYMEYDLAPKDWMMLKAENNCLIRRLSLLDMTLVLTCHQKTLYADSGFMQKAGDTFDSEKKLGHFCDTVFQMERVNDQFTATVKKIRGKSLANNRIIIPPPPDSLLIFNDLFGENLLTKEAKPVIFITGEQVGEIGTCIVQLQMPDAKVKKALRARNVDRIEDLTEEQAADMIESLHKLIKKGKK